METSERLWYMSYGSNMNPIIFEKRRGIKPRTTRCVKIPGYVFSYSYDGVPYLEPAFATCHKREETPYQCSVKHPDIQVRISL